MTIINRSEDSVKDASGLALNALAWVLSDTVRAERFLSVTGLDADGLRASLGEPATHRAYCHPDNYDGLANLLFRNKGDGTFADVSDAAGIADAAGKGLGLAFADYDGDGKTDVAWNNSVWRSVSVYKNVTQDGQPGDGNGDGQTDLQDVQLAMKAAIKLHSPSTEEAARLDVSPVQPDGSWGDGRVTIEDAVRILHWWIGPDVSLKS
jgi:hypothetical protein